MTYVRTHNGGSAMEPARAVNLTHAERVAVVTALTEWCATYDTGVRVACYKDARAVLARMLHEDEEAGHGIE